MRCGASMNKLEQDVEGMETELCRWKKISEDEKNSGNSLDGEYSKCLKCSGYEKGKSCYAPILLGFFKMIR